MALMVTVGVLVLLSDWLVVSVIVWDTEGVGVTLTLGVLVVDGV